ncbi:HD domain-containing phosphohydrolase [Haliovirga abyssi]|uniref:Metal-dependent phosphohydrolase n=1 Tax=Haliovirga abyssi TaxID=2996794 RepID=A0AAU9D7S7_9FUSO|nr:HD domain-containing phosphohydrolase [Haliovirga abyssi]BDU49626.1 metal-dependent phosphohydrolase [Haliovirga abyssi]
MKNYFDDIEDKNEVQKYLIGTIENNFEIVIITNNDGVISYISKSGENYTGYELIDIEEKSIFDFIKGKTIRDKFLKKSLNKTSVEFKLKKRGIRNFKITIYKIETNKYIWYFTDITMEVKKIETILESLSLRNIIYNIMEEFIFSFQILVGDKLTSLYEVNSSLEKVLGYNREELYKKKVVDIIKCDFNKMISKLYSEKQFTEETLLIKSNGDELPIKAKFILLEGYEPKTVVVIARDISVEKEVKSLLLENIKNNDIMVDNIVETMSKIVEKRDPYTVGHQKSVSEISVKIGKEMGFSKDRLRGLEIAGILHDLGKVAIPIEILTKPGKLMEEEFNLIKKHSEIGYDILKDIKFPWEIAEFVLQHHERINGSGYPLGLKGDNISLESKILAVADVIDAMASHRPYRAALGLKSAMEEIEGKKGILYDERVVNSAIKVLGKGEKL